MKSPNLRRVVLLALVLTSLTSCGTAFRKAWKDAPGAKTANHPHICLPLRPPPVPGRWEGSWHSDASGHHGRLRCVISRPVNTSGDHEFFYHATWMGFLSGAYKAVHRVEKKGDLYAFKGQHKMPDWAGGLYHYEGTIQGNEFKANYKSSADHGTFTMKRAR